VKRAAIHRRAVLTGLGAGISLGALPKRARAAAAETKEAITILGTGRYGSTLGKLWAARGHPIHFGSRTPQDTRVKALLEACGPKASASEPSEAAARADIVVFALPWKGAQELLPSLGELTGKTLIDPMNALKMVARYPESPPDLATSIAEELQIALRGAHVVKALNTPAARNIVNPERVATPLTIAMAGENAAAKARVAAIVSELGLEPLDVGPLIAARYLEGMMRLSVGYFMYSGRAFEFYLSPVKNA
jgi:8-hydroxy-5-deazaflavin:NADPH oxidoreductase